MKIFGITSLLFLCSLYLNAQSGYSYREYNRDRCIDIEREFGRRPQGMYLFPSIVGDMIYMIYDDKDWFDEFFDKPFLRLGLKMISADYFECGPMNITDLDRYYFNFTPLSYKEMSDNTTPHNGAYKTPIGIIPYNLRNTEFDIGMIISHRRRECSSHWMRKVEVHDWEFMGNALLVDTLIFPDDDIILKREKLPLRILKQRTLNVSFLKDEVSFDKDILTDFILQLPTIDYEIMDVSIEAFASVEGPEKRNIELYWRRSEVVFEEIKKFYGDYVIYQCMVEENWDAFFDDIKETQYSYLANKSKSEIRLYIDNDKVKDDLEEIFDKHRIAKITVTLHKSINVEKSTGKELVDFYVETLINEDFSNALKVQDALFERIKNEKVDVKFPGELPVPKSQKFSFILNRDYTFRYKMGINDMQTTYKLYQQLLKIFPDDPRIVFNITELMFRRWSLNDPEISDEKLFKAISDLGNYDIPANAANRLLINYHIILAERSRLDEDRRQLNSSLRAIRNLFANTVLRDHEVLSIAKLFVAYNESTMAERILKPYAQRLLPNQDLLFYYLSITIIDDRTISSRWYISLLDYARESNPVRFCEMFKPHSIGGSGAFLLFNKELKKLYCETCE